MQPIEILDDNKAELEALGLDYYWLRAQEYHAENAARGIREAAPGAPRSLVPDYDLEEAPTYSTGVCCCNGDNGERLHVILWKSRRGWTVFDIRPQGEA